jgi:hypothetical protein
MGLVSVFGASYRVGNWLGKGLFCVWLLLYGVIHTLELDGIRKSYYQEIIVVFGFYSIFLTLAIGERDLSVSVSFGMLNVRIAWAIESNILGLGQQPSNSELENIPW